MKKIITLGVFFALFAVVNIFGQNIISNCNSVEVTGVSSPTGLYFYNNSRPGPNSCQETVATFQRTTTVFALSKIENGTAVDFRNYQESSKFNNLPQGTYLVSVSTPVKLITSVCPNGVEVFDVLSRSIGYKADLPRVTSTGTAIVGVPAGDNAHSIDNSWLFLDGNGRNIPNDIPLYDPNEMVQIDASASKNFDRYGIAIQEIWADGTLGRWRALGNNGYGSWQNYKSIGVWNLTSIWNLGDPVNGWKFLPGNRYNVQVTISNSNCASWVDLIRPFIVCYPNWMCRAGSDLSKPEIAIIPNPVSSKFSIKNFEFNISKEFKDELMIYDITGKLVQNVKNIVTNEFDVNSLATGVYLVSVLRDNHKLFTQKMFINH